MLQIGNEYFAACDPLGKIALGRPDSLLNSFKRVDGAPPPDPFCTFIYHVEMRVLTEEQSAAIYDLFTMCLLVF